MNDKLDSIMDEFDDSLWAMAAEIERLRAMLAQCEYSDYQDGPDPLCPVCGYSRQHGHGDNCEMAAAIAGVEDGDE